MVVPSWVDAHPLSPATPSSDPVLALILPAAGVFTKRRCSVPLPPATGRALSRAPPSPELSSSFWRRSQVTRSERSRPDPSAAVSSSAGSPVSDRWRRTTSRPAAVDPAPPNRLPSSFTSISAARLSLCWSVSPTTSVRGGDSIDVTVTVPAGATPSAAGPSTATPLAFSRSDSTVAACVAWDGVTTVGGLNVRKPLFTVRADRGLISKLVR